VWISPIKPWIALRKGASVRGSSGTAIDGMRIPMKSSPGSGTRGSWRDHRINEIGDKIVQVRENSRDFRYARIGQDDQ